MTNIETELLKLISSKKKSSYYENQSDTVFHVTEAAKCSEKVFLDRIENKKKTFKSVVEPAYFSLGKAYEQFIRKKLPKWDELKTGQFSKWEPVFIPFTYGMGFTGSPDIIYKEGNLRIPIEIKTTKSADLEWYAANEKILIQGTAYAYGMMADTWYLLAVSKTSDQQRFFKKNVKDKVYKDMDIEQFLKRKFIDLTNSRDEFSPLWSWECDWCQHKDSCRKWKDL